MTYSQAKRVALARNPRFNRCREYADAYHFYDDSDTEERTPDQDVVILKDTAKIVNFSTYVIEYRPRSIPIERRLDTE